MTQVMPMDSQVWETPGHPGDLRASRIISSLKQGDKVYVGIR